MASSQRDSGALQATIVRGLDAIAPAEWNRLGGDVDPFISHEYLVALERHGCLGESFGWYPHHVVVRTASGQLVGATPMYIKTNSYGEFVFDWAWASAYERGGIDYYPKVVASVPYTPVTGARLLTLPGHDPKPVKELLIERAIRLAGENRLSSVHWLFTDADDTQALRNHDLMLRLGCQYHWYNNDYRSFEHFLGDLNSRKRKKVRRERERVREQGIRLRVIHGDEADDGLWRKVHHFYVDTFDRKMGIPTLTLDFFREIGRTLGRRIVLVVAEFQGRMVACAINFRSRDSLFGRHWGCEQDFHSLHFEACYYQGIDYCIRHGLQRFEPGAQGEHKIARGFLPTRTWSAHWIAHPSYREILGDYCRREQTMMRAECNALMERSPFRSETHPSGAQGPDRHESLDIS